jgi:hypothetical protein
MYNNYNIYYLSFFSRKMNYDTILEQTLGVFPDAFITGLYKANADNYSVSEATLCKGMQTNGLFLQYVREQDRNQNVCLDAVKQNGMAFPYVPNTVSGVAVVDALAASDPLPPDNIAIAALSSNGLALQFMPDLSDNPSVCLVAATSAGDSLQYMSPVMLASSYGLNIMQKAIQQTPFCIIYIKKSYFSNEADYYSLCTSAVSRRGELLQYVDCPTANVCNIAVQANPYAIQFVPTNIC